MTFLSIERLVLAIYAQASATAILREIIGHCNGRKTGERSVLDFQSMSFKLADLFSECAVNQAFIDRCIIEHLHGRYDPKSACIAKLRATEVLKSVAAIGIQFRGASGISGPDGGRVAQDLVDSSVQSIWGGTSEVLRDVLGRSLVNWL